MSERIFFSNRTDNIHSGFSKLIFEFTRKYSTSERTIFKVTDDSQL
jgi:hypothetical protein